MPAGSWAAVDRGAPTRACDPPFRGFTGWTVLRAMSGTSMPLARAAALAAFTRSTLALFSLAASTRCAWVMRICAFMFLMRAAFCMSGSTWTWSFAACARES